YKFLLDEGLDLNSLCYTEKEKNIFQSLVNSCNHEALNLVPIAQSQLNTISREDTERLFYDWKYASSDYGINCFETIKTIASKNIAYDRYGFLRAILELELKSVVDKAIEAKLI